MFRSFPLPFLFWFYRNAGLRGTDMELQLLLLSHKELLPVALSECETQTGAGAVLETSRVDMFSYLGGEGLSRQQRDMVYVVLCFQGQHRY